VPRQYCTFAEVGFNPAVGVFTIPVNYFYKTVIINAHDVICISVKFFHGAGQGGRCGNVAVGCDPSVLRSISKRSTFISAPVAIKQRCFVFVLLH
jgi:hypothetical protein